MNSAPGTSALVLEGGGMRAQYTSGVLDHFLDMGLEFPYVIGVSAGISNATSLVSKQRGRNRKIFTTFAGDPRYFAWRNLLFQGNPFGMDFIYSEIPYHHAPFDFETFAAAPGKFLAGVTHCRSGKAIFFDKHDAPILDSLRASASLPVIGRMVSIQGELYLDGGIADPIPLKKAYTDGCSKAVVILTRNKGFKKHGPGKAARAFTRVKYRHFPELRDAVLNQHHLYNQTLEFVDQEEAAGRIFVIRPTRPLQVGRYSQDVSHLETLYQNGLNDAKACEDALRRFLKQPE